MAVYEDNEITAELINEQFPAVASAIIAGAEQPQVEITADMIRESYPDIAAAFVAEGEQNGRAAGAEAEANRIASIEAVGMAGYEEIVAAAKADGKSTADDVKLAIFDAMQAKQANMKHARAVDGANLAAQVAELNEGANGEADALSDEDKAVEAMKAAAQKVKGE